MSVMNADEVLLGGGLTEPSEGYTSAVGYDQRREGGVAACGQDIRALDDSKLCQIFDDFLGDALLQDGTTFWLQSDTSAAGTPTFATKDDAGSGVLEMTLAADSEAEVIDLTMGDNLQIPVDKKPLFIARVQAAVLPSTAERMAFGLQSARNSTLDSVAQLAAFRLEANASLLLESDDATLNVDDKDTGVDLTAATWYEFAIDCWDPEDIKFYYRTSLGAAWTRLYDVASDLTKFKLLTTANVQPFFFLQKDSGTGVPSMLIDYVKVIWQRGD